MSHLRSAMLSLALALGVAGTAWAAPSSGESKAAQVLAPAFGNTVVSTYPDGRTGLLWLKPDGSYAAKGRRRTPSSGTWSLKGEKVCLKQRKPRRAPFNYCTATPSGTTWSAKAVTGEAIRVKIVKGVVEP